jgi:hypothetical protein
MSRHVSLIVLALALLSGSQAHAQLGKVSAQQLVIRAAAGDVPPAVEIRRRLG